MKTYIVVIIVLVLLLSLTLLCGCMKTEVKPYEGFREGATEEDAEAEEGPEEEETEDNSEEGEKKETEDNSEEGEKKEGFTGLSYADINNIKTIDTISTVKGSINCLAGSSNLTNSMGPLCLSLIHI